MSSRTRGGKRTPLSAIKVTTQVTPSSSTTSSTSTTPSSTPSSTPLHPTHVSIDIFLKNVKISDVPVFTNQQVDKLTTLLGKNGLPLLTMEDKYLLYEIIYLTLKIGFDTIYQYLTSRNFSDSKEIIMESPLMLDYKNKVSFDISQSQMMAPTSLGLYKCPRCGSEYTVSMDKATRAADESLTTFVQCMSCNCRWKPPR